MTPRSDHCKYTVCCCPPVDGTADLLSGTERWLHNGNLLGEVMVYSVYLLVMLALFPTTWMSDEFLLATQSVWRIQHGGMRWFSFSTTAQEVFLKEISRINNICFMYSHFTHLIVVRLHVFNVSYLIPVCVLQFKSIPCLNTNQS